MVGIRINASVKAGNDSFNSVVVRSRGYRNTGVAAPVKVDDAAADEEDADEAVEGDELDEAAAEKAVAVALRAYSEHMSATVLRSSRDRDSHCEMNRTKSLHACARGPSAESGR